MPEVALLIVSAGLNFSAGLGFGFDFGLARTDLN
jgi:hypothetical protein